MTQYNIGTISFDALGNPTSYYNDYRYTNMTWTHGRQLASLKKNLSGGVVNTVSYSYNADGSNAIDIIELLLRYGADPNICNNYGVSVIEMFSAYPNIIENLKRGK